MHGGSGVMVVLDGGSGGGWKKSRGSVVVYGCM